MSRDYRKEYDEYHGTPEQIKRRAARVKARRYMEKNGSARKGDGKMSIIETVIHSTAILVI